MIWLVTILTLLTVSVCENSQHDLFIQYAAVIFRHGDRTPVDMFPTDPYKNESLWPVKFGQLTNTGKRQHFALGKWLRERYAHLISSQFDPTEISVRSTDVDRTLMSVEANLAGMYPPVGNAVWNDQLNWQPIPVHTVPENRDEILAMLRRCPAYDKALADYKESNEYKDRLAKYQDLMDYLTAYTGKKIKDYYDVLTVYSNLNIETLYNFTLPNWTHSVYPDRLRDPACYSFKVPTITPLLARLKAGPLIQEIVMNMANTSLTYPEGYHKTVKLSVYSGHDITVASVLNALNLYDDNCPVYTSTILLELLYSNSTNEHFVRISYRNFTDIEEPHVLNIPYCGEVCNFARFVQLYEKLLDINWEFECSKQFNPVIGASLLFSVGCVAALIVAHKTLFTRPRRTYISTERQFLSDFVAGAESTAGGRLARWLAPTPRVEPAKCELRAPATPVRPAARITLPVLVRDQYGESVASPALKVEAYQNYSFEELRTEGTGGWSNWAEAGNARVPAERLPVRAQPDGSYAAAWTPRAPGAYQLRCTLDELPAPQELTIEVVESTSEGPGERGLGGEPARLRRFAARSTAGLRVRASPSLQAEELGRVPPGTTVACVEEVVNKDGTWVRLGAESARAHADGGAGAAWCLQHHRHLDRALLLPVDASSPPQSEYTGIWSGYGDAHGDMQSWTHEDDIDINGCI